jgi:dipeptidyl aminopeptidase/acylaminoacyl peptidase
MRLATTLLSLLVLVPTPLALRAQESPGLTPHQVARLRLVTSAHPSPDARQVAYTLSAPREPGMGDDGPAWSELHVLSVSDGRSRPFVTGEVSVSSVRWTADGDALLFRTKRSGDDGTCLYRIPVTGGEARRVLALETSIGAYDVAPDGRRVVCIASAPKDEAREARVEKGFKQEIYEEEGRASELWIATLDGSEEPRRLAFEGHPRDVRWSPVDDRIMVAWTPTTLIDDDYVAKRVVILDGSDGTVRARIDNPGKLGQIEWSPDGKRVALISAADRNDPNAGRLTLAPATGGVPADPFPGLEADVESLAWKGPASLTMVLHTGCESSVEDVTLAADGSASRSPRVAAGGPSFNAVDLAGDGSAVLLASAPTHYQEAFLLPAGGSEPRRLTDSNPWLAEVPLARQEIVAFQARDGLALEGLLIHPLERAEGQRVPLILIVHGGPESHYSNGWLTSYSSPGQTAAARGMAAFYPNYRGSTGRGVAFSKLSQGDAGGKEFDDLVDAVDHLVAIGLVDEKRVGVTGGSYGGYATGWCSTRLSEHFAAGVMFVGISNRISKLGTTDIPMEEYEVHARMRPWDDWQLYLERSPVYWAGESKTPLLILHGKDDPRVHPGQSMELYRNLKLRGQAPVRLVLYPGEGHGNRNAAARLDYSLRSLRWFEHYLTGPGGEPPAREVDYAEPEPVRQEG